MKPITGIPWLVAAGFLAGCQPVDPDRPPTVRFGEEACAACRMIISDERFAAALITGAGDTLKFDDIGCLIEHQGGRVGPDVACWVRNFNGQEWLKAPSATFLHSPSVDSPMGYGLAALPGGHQAHELATRPDSRSLKFDELSGFLAERARQPASQSQKSP
jgi:copper chaperone NosL